MQLKLGQFVTLRPRKDGTFNVLFEIPRRLRPAEMMPTTPLPRQGCRTGDLGDLEEVVRIKADAAALLAEYTAQKTGVSPASSKANAVARRTILTLVENWRQSKRYKKHRPKTHIQYELCTKYVIAWSESQGHPDPSKMTQPRVEQFLSNWDDKPSTQHKIKKAFKLIMDQAILLGWRTDNPVHKIATEEPESKVDIWEQSDVDLYAAACVAARKPSLAALILTQWQIGQRLTDVRTFRWEETYQDGAFRFYQSKTGQYVTLPISKTLQTLLENSRNPASNYLFINAATDVPYTEQNLAVNFCAVRERIRKPGERKLVIRALRHSCVVQLARFGATVPEIGAVTGHSLNSVETILQRYLPRDNVVAWNAMAKRGLIQEGVVCRGTVFAHDDADADKGDDLRRNTPTSVSSASDGESDGESDSLIE